MYLDFIDDNEYNKRKQEAINSLTEEQKTDIIFEGEKLYYLGGGHDFVFSFFKEYVTKSGVEAKHYLSDDYWIINNVKFLYKNNSFLLVVKKPKNIEQETDWSNFIFPIAKKIKPTLLSDLIEPVIPISKPK